MTDVFTPEKRSAVMRRVKGKDTAPELKVRALLRKMGVGYRLHCADLPGKPDIAMPGRKLAIFVHGCFWHGHDCARGARVPKANRAYWEAKVGRNRARDAEHRAALEAKGWRAVTLWECELKDESQLERELRKRSPSPSMGEGWVGVQVGRRQEMAREAAPPRLFVRKPHRSTPIPALPHRGGREMGLPAPAG